MLLVRCAVCGLSFSAGKGVTAASAAAVAEAVLCVGQSGHPVPPPMLTSFKAEPCSNRTWSLVSAVEVSSCLAPPTLHNTAIPAVPAQVQTITGTIHLDRPMPFQVPICVCTPRPTFRAPALEYQEAQSTTPVPPRLPPVLVVASCSNQNPARRLPHRLALAVLQTAIPAVPAQLQAITGTALLDRPVPPVPVLVCPLTPPCNVSALQAEPTTPVHTPRLPPVLPAVAA
jgi:hypothetical protein